MANTGFKRAVIKQIAASAREWPGNWSLDIAGDVRTPSIVLIPEKVDEAPSFHIEQTVDALLVVAVRGDELQLIGMFSTVQLALQALEDFVGDVGWCSGRLG